MITSQNQVRPFVIATPTKCGTTTLEEMARRHGGGRVSRGGVEVPSFRIYTDEKPRRQHRMALPDGEEWIWADRYLMIRNPYTRYISMYEYLRAPHNYSKFGAREVQGRQWGGIARGMHSEHSRNKPMAFKVFLYFIAESRITFSDKRWSKRRGDMRHPFAYRSPWVWLDPLTVSYNALRDAAPLRESVRVETLRMEALWSEMAKLKERYQLNTLSVRPTIRANRTLTYQGTAEAYWDAVSGCSAGLFSGWGFLGNQRRTDPGCGCAACVVGVADEAIMLRYR